MRFKHRVKFTVPCAALAIACLCATTALAAGPTSEGEVASMSISRGALSPDFGHAFGYGYYTYINGITGSMFNGTPSEATAYFTFKTTVATTLPLPQNVDETLVISSGAVYDIYLNLNPNHNWSDPDSFAIGTKVATFRRTGFILSGVGFAAYETFNSTLLYSQPFTFNGQRIDFKNVTLGLRTSNMFGRLPFPSGFTDFPTNLSFTGYAVATHLPEVISTTAVAEPKGTTAYTSPMMLDGTKSTSSDGQPLTYQWSLSATSPTGTITNGNTATPTVTFTAPGLYRFDLTVTDSQGYSTTDKLKVNYVGGQ